MLKFPIFFSNGTYKDWPLLHKSYSKMSNDKKGRYTLVHFEKKVENEVSGSKKYIFF